MNQTFRNILAILAPKEKSRFFILIFLDLLVSILDVAFLVALLYVIGYYTKSYQPDELFFIPVSFFERNSLLLISIFFLLFSLKNLFAFLVGRMQFRFVYKVASRISENELRVYFDSTYEEFVGIDSSVHIRKIGQQPVEFAHYVLRGMQLIISNLLLLVITIIPIIIFSSTLFTLLLLVLLPPVAATVIFAKKKLVSIRASNKSNRDKTMQHLHESLSGFIEININSLKIFFVERYARFQERFNASLAELQVVQSLPARLMEVFAVFGLFVLVTASLLTRNTGTMHVLLIGGFMAAAYKIIPGVVKILNSWEQIRTYGYTIDELRKNSTPTYSSSTIVEIPISEVEFRKVSFSYKDVNVVNDFSLKMKAGDLVGLSGLSGSGKTTILNILLGFLTPAAGSVLINGNEINEESRRSSWNRISYARQQPFFIHESVKINILLGKEADPAKLDNVISATGLKEVIEIHPEGVDTLVAENGKNFSGGQRQRIILARTLYKDADLFILDEPFNELDEGSTTRMLLHLKNLAASGKMILMVTHDENSLSYCNKVVSLNRGTPKPPEGGFSLR